MTQDALLPCPFCGGSPDIEPWHGGSRTKKLISCPGTYANSLMGHGEEITCPVAPMVSGETKMEAIQRWNSRAPVTQCEQPVVDAAQFANEILGGCVAEVSINNNISHVELNFDKAVKLIEQRDAQLKASPDNEKRVEAAYKRYWELMDVVSTRKLSDADNEVISFWTQVIKAADEAGRL